MLDIYVKCPLVHFSLPLGRLFHSSPDNNMEIVLNGPFRFSSCFKLILGTSPILFYGRFTCGPGAANQAQTLEPVLKRGNCGEPLLQGVKIQIYESFYSTFLVWLLQFKWGLNSPQTVKYDFPSSFSFFLPKSSNGIIFHFWELKWTSHCSGCGGALGFYFHAESVPFFSAIGFKQ